MNKRVFSILLCSLVLVVAIAIFGFYHPQRKSLPVQPVSQTTASPSTSPSAPTAIEGWRTCAYSAFGIQFQYPADWVVGYISSAEGGGSRPPIVVGGCSDAQPPGLDLRLGLPQEVTDMDGGMIIQPQNPATAISPAGTSTVGGKESVILDDGSIIVGGYHISFWNDVDTSTRAKILETFRFE